jgi:hypothetical protein
MTTMKSFVDEMTKIAASSCAAKNVKSRSGRRPIRAAKLLKKAQAPAAAAAQIPWLSSAVQKGLPFLSAHRKTLGTVGLTSAGLLGLQRGIEDIRMAEQMRAMQRG